APAAGRTGRAGDRGADLRMAGAPAPASLVPPLQRAGGHRPPGGGIAASIAAPTLSSFPAFAPVQQIGQEEPKKTQVSPGRRSTVAGKFADGACWCRNSNLVASGSGGRPAARYNRASSRIDHGND